MISTLAMFGNNSWWHAVAPGNETLSILSNDSIAEGLTSICQTVAIPFSGFQLTTNSFGTAASYYIDVNGGLYDDDTNSDWQAVRLRSIVYGWISSFNRDWLYENDTANILEPSTFFADEAVLSASSDLNYAFGAKWIYTSEGTIFYQLYKSLGGMISVTALIFLQAIALLILAWYMHATGPVWTDTLDGLVGVAARDKGGNEVEDAPLLESAAGEGEQNGGTAMGEQKRTLDVTERPLLLRLGAPGIITKDMAKRGREEKKKQREVV